MRFESSTYKYRKHIFAVDYGFRLYSYAVIFQATLSSLTRNALSRELDSYSEVCEALKIAELLLGFLSTGGDPMMSLVTYLQDILKMVQRIDKHILQVNASISGAIVKVSLSLRKVTLCQYKLGDNHFHSKHINRMLCFSVHLVRNYCFKTDFKMCKSHH